MKLPMIYPAPSASRSRNEDRMNSSNHTDELEATRRQEPMMALGNPCPGLRMASSSETSSSSSSSSSLQRNGDGDGLFQWIEDALAFELECLERLSSSSSSAHKAKGDASVDVDGTALEDAPASRKTASSKDTSSNKENAVQKRRAAKDELHTVRSSSSSNNKENTTANGHPPPEKKDLIRLPFVDWKTTLVKAKRVHMLDASTSASDGSEALGRIGPVVSNIVQGWLGVLARLNANHADSDSHNEKAERQSGGNGSGLGGSFAGDNDLSSSPSLSKFSFSAATSYRSQIYRRLTLLLLGFVSLVDTSPSSTTTRSGDPSGIDQKMMELELQLQKSTSHHPEASRIVGHTRDLARKILKQEGSYMKKNTTNNHHHKLPVAVSVSQACIQADGIYYYCWFTAIAAECGEFLGDLDMALLAYKSIRAMEDRLFQQQNNVDVDGDSGNDNDNANHNLGMYARWDPSLEGTRADHTVELEHEHGHSLGLEDNEDEDCLLPTSFSLEAEQTTAADPGNYNSPRITVTKTPANTPSVQVRKKRATASRSNATTATTALAASSSSWIGVVTSNHNMANPPHPLGIRRSGRNPLFSPIPSGPKRVWPVGFGSSCDDAEVRGSGNPNSTTKSSSGGYGSNSKIGNDLVSSGTLEERIRRCSLEDSTRSGLE